MDRSLLFFYCLVIALLIYSIFKIKNDRYKWQGLTLVFSVVVNCFISSSLFNIFSGYWWLSLIAGSVILIVILVVPTEFIKQYITSKYLKKIIASLKDTTTEEMSHRLISHHNKKQWYVLNSPSNNSIEIGLNIFNTTPIIGKKFYIKTLTQRYIFIIPEYQPNEFSLTNDFICTLPDFYKANPQTQALVENYIDRVKVGEPEPWVVKPQ